MDLKQYLETLDEKAIKAFVKAAGTELSYLPHLLGGFRRASPQLANRIEAASNGKVRREEMRPDIFSKVG